MRSYRIALTGLWLAVSAVSFNQAPALAQESSASDLCRPEASRKGCGAFWITEAGIALRKYPDSEGGGLRWWPSADAGRMMTFGRNLGVGVTGFFGWNDTPRVGVKLRGRLWLNDDWSVEVAPGVQFTDWPALTSHAALNYRDMVALTIHQEVYEDNDGSRVNHYAGITFGSKPGKIAFVVGGLATAVGFLVYAKSVEN